MYNELIGQKVEMVFRDSMYGDLTLRWGTLRCVEEGGTLIIDDYHDSAGIGAYLPGRGCNVRNGVPVTASNLLRFGRPSRV